MVNSIIPLAFDLWAISTPGLCWAIEVREFPAGQSHVGGTEGHRLTRQKTQKSGWKPHVAKIQVLRVWFLSIHSSRFFFIQFSEAKTIEAFSPSVILNVGWLLRY